MVPVDADPVSVFASGAKAERTPIPNFQNVAAVDTTSTKSSTART
jgi:hypothetical protein